MDKTIRDISGALIIALGCSLAPMVALCQTPLTLDQYITQHNEHARIQLPNNINMESLAHSTVNQNLTLSNKYIGSSNSIKGWLKKTTNDINLSNVLINTDIEINFSKISSPVEINSLTLQKDASLNFNTYEKSFFAQNMRADRNLYLRQSLFYGKTNWMNIDCQQTCDFTLNKYLKTFRLSHSKFEQDVNLAGSVFYKQATLEKNRFKGSINLSKSIYYDGINFSKTSINNGIDLSNSTAKNDINFNNTMIRNYIDISNMTLDNAEINLSSIMPLNIKNRINIYLTNTNLDKINMDYTHFNIAFKEGATYSTKIWTYNKLLEKIKLTGDSPSYNRLFIELKQFQYEHHDAYIANFISHYFWNYGLDTGMPVMWCVAVFLIYCIINAIMFPKLINSYVSDIKLFSNIHAEDRKTNPITRFVCDFPLAMILTFVIFIGGFLRIGVLSANFHGQNFLILVYLVLINVTGFATILAIIQFIF